MSRPVQLLSIALACLVAGCTPLTRAVQSAIHEGAANAARPYPAGKVHEDAFFAPSLGVRKHMVVYLPPSYGRDTTRRYPVAYYLHGLGGTETDWLSKASIDLVADSLFARGTPEMIIVLPDGDDGWYTTWVDPVPYRACADTTKTETASRYCVNQSRYDEYIARDVVRHVDSTYHTRPDRDNRGIGGLSMGGYGAVSLALHYPDVFGAAASHSGVLAPMYAGPHPFVGPARYATNTEELRAGSGIYWPRYLRYWGTNLDRWRIADPALSASRLKQRGQRMPALFFDVGRDDGFADQNRAFDAELTSMGIAHSYSEWPGAHTWRYWSEHVPQSLAWMARRIHP